MGADLQGETIMRNMWEREKLKIMSILVSDSLLDPIPSPYEA